MKTQQQQIALERAEIMMAFANGSEIEVGCEVSDVWSYTSHPFWNWIGYDYRVKVETPAFWEAEDGKIGWIINPLGIAESYICWNKAEILSGQICETKELAKQARDIQLATQRLKKAIFEINEGVSYPFVVSGNNVTPTLRADIAVSDIWCINKTNPNWMYMRDTEACDKLIASHSKDLKLVLSQ